jgi:hypothetical protein
VRKCLIILLGLACLDTGLAYGPAGHTLVGDIAAARLDSGTTLKIKGLIGDLDLGFAARLPDDIKNWDPHAKQYPDSVADLKLLDTPQYQSLKAALRAFHDANMTTTTQNPTELLHHQFHYVDVPAKNVTKYAAGKTGRTPTDIVQMIKFCVGVLHGDISPSNEFKITRPVAVILLAHYVGDIHQPLHVGAEYFTQAGQKIDPDIEKNETGYPDEGGNSIVIGSINGITSDSHGTKFHGIWDSALVDEAMRQIRGASASMTQQQYVQFYLDHPPANWKPDGSLPVSRWSEAWADEIQPIAREAHERLVFQNIQIESDKGVQVAHGTVSEPTSDAGYVKWAGGIVENELGLAGYRLAALLESALP